MPLPDDKHNPGQPEVDSADRREALRRLAKLGIAAGAAPAMITLLWSDRASAQSGPLASSVTATFARNDYSSGGPFRVTFPEGILDLQTGENITTVWSYDPHGIETLCRAYFYNSSGRSTQPVAIHTTSSAGTVGPTTNPVPPPYMPPDGEYPEGIEMEIASGGTDFETVLTFSV
jgi:hypothetical protein